MPVPMEIDDANIITITIFLMEEVEKIYAIKTGEQKKQYVLDCLKTKLGDGPYERYKPLIDLIIDFIVEVSNGNVILHLNKIKNKFCCF